MKNVITRLKKVEGQINGIVRMLEKQEDCEKILIQFQASKAALEAAFAEALHQNLEKCFTQKDSEKRAKIIKLLSKI